MTSIEKLNQLCEEYKNILFVTKNDGAPCLINICCTPECTKEEVEDFLQNIPLGITHEITKEGPK